MSDRKFISRYTPRRTDFALLESINVPIDGHVDRALRGIRENATTGHTRHFLYYGAVGSGKSHLIRMLEHRVSQDKEIREMCLIAWLNEDESSTSFLDVLARTYRALAERYPKEFPLDELEALYGTDPETALPSLEFLLQERCSGKALIMLVENTDSILSQLPGIDLKRWRGYLQNTRFITTVATAKQLVGEMREHEEPFYGFFDTYHLRAFRLDEAIAFLSAVSRENGDSELQEYLTTEHGHARVRALHRLTGGNPRLFVVFSDFLTHEGLDSLVRIIEELVDEQLTPYFRDRLQRLSPLQRKIMEVLCAQGAPIAVKDIAAALFSPPTSVAPQLKRLRAMGYVLPNSRGRETLYELTEPLMRISLDVKQQNIGQSLRTLTSFLRIWYGGKILQVWSAFTDAPEEMKGATEGILAEGSKEDLSSMLSPQEVVRKIFESGHSQANWKPTIYDVFQWSQKSGQLVALGNALVRHLADLEVLDSNTSGLMDRWWMLWDEVGQGSPEFGLSLRLLRVGIAYLKSRDASGEGDLGVLLELASEERVVVREALGLM